MLVLVYSRELVKASVKKVSVKCVYITERLKSIEIFPYGRLHGIPFVAITDIYFKHKSVLS